MFSKLSAKDGLIQDQKISLENQKGNKKPPLCTRADLR